MEKVKTSVYLNREQADQMESAARLLGLSKAELIRGGIDLMILRSPLPPRKRAMPSFSYGDPTFASRSDEMLSDAYGDS